MTQISGRPFRQVVRRLCEPTLGKLSLTVMERRNQFEALPTPLGWPIHPASCFCPPHTFRRPSKTRALNLRLDSSLGSSSHHPTLPPLSPYLDRHPTVVCESHRFLGDVYSSKGEREKDIHHFEAALKIASPFNWNDQPFWIYHSLAD